ncbi:homeobox-leucine zipper protein PROTODERMAL FACTOR 2-like [Andrographis paniculata]|uniref:homeobox-leucine zipper protein PROTODERMAL FACTOR 2-like n=1 Tax=Andrographis paniculata TaxID=175694 RepID=UPI0021E77908|nr:homeobox-leucine zipper protein PROTODERMAL FACTOR 2-like [Andrographis paniculata]
MFNPSNVFDGQSDLLELARQAATTAGQNEPPPPPPPPQQMPAMVVHHPRGGDLESRMANHVMDPSSGDDQEPPKKKQYHRHTQHQIQEMEAFFKECPHPDDKQRKELGRRLGLEPLQVKFWFQNKRTQMKAHHERNENTQLRHENDKLRAESLRYKEALSNAICPTCGGPAAFGDMSFDEQHLRMENARLREEIERMAGMASRYAGKSVVAYPNLMPHPQIENGVGTYGGQFGMGLGNLMYASNTDLLRMVASSPICDMSMIIDLAVTAMEELLRMAQAGEPLWMSSIDNSLEMLNEDEYFRSFPRGIGSKVIGMATEASRDSTVVMMHHSNIVEIMMNVDRWNKVFCNIVYHGSTLDILTNGATGTYNGALQVMSAEMHVPSPFVATRKSYFVRYCKEHTTGTWAIVDVSVDDFWPREGLRCRRRPSGCLIQELQNGYSKVTWVEHVEVYHKDVHSLYIPLVYSGLGFGARRWLTTLERQCERLENLLANAVSPSDYGVVTSPEGRKSILKLAERMLMSFCDGAGAATGETWAVLSGNGLNDIRAMTRKSINDPGKPPGIILSAATSFWLHLPPKRVFEFLRSHTTRNKWDVLSNNSEVTEMAYIANGSDPGNSVSLLRVNGMNQNQNNMLILQDSCFDASGAFVVYAPVDIVAMNIVLSGGDSEYVAFLPSGFAILPDGPKTPSHYGGDGVMDIGSGGSLVTVAFQILIDSIPTAQMSLSSVNTVYNLIRCTVDRIKASVGGHDDI